MGGGSWSSYDYDRSVRGADAFAYSRRTMSARVDERRIHQLLDPSNLLVRESRDSAEHPLSNAIAVGLDVTGSMDRVVVAIQAALGKLMELLLSRNFIADPQLLCYAVGDATCDQFPFQIGQFESDNRINEQVTNLILERGGGGQDTESYELGFYTMARHTSTDCFERRGNKGYLFSIGDERTYPEVSARQVQKIFGAGLEADIPTRQIVREAQQRFNVFHIIPRGSANFERREIRQAWVELLGNERYVLMFDEPTATAELIAVTIGLNEGNITLEQGVGMVREISGETAAEAVRRVLTPLAEYLETLPKKQNKKKRPRKKIKTNQQSGQQPPDPEDWKLM